MTNEEMLQQKAEEDFKRSFFQALLKAGEDASVDEDGFIVVRRPVDELVTDEDP